MTPMAAIITDPVSEFRQALEAAGLQPGEVCPDDTLRRCGTVDHPKSSNGWHVLHADPFAGAYGIWSTGLSESWSMAGEPLPPAARQRLKQDIERQRAERLKAEAETRAAAITAARGYLDGLKPATDQNPYLLKKGVKAVPGLLVDGDVLVLPVLGADGRPMSYQKIGADGNKRFAPGAPVAGGFFPVGPKSCKLPLLAGEGLATILSAYEATGFPCLAAFSAKNLLAVATMARQRYPERRIILCADNDTGTEAKTGRNPGVDAAKAAALAVNGLLAVPESGGDFNDLHRAQGLEAVKTGIDAARPVEMETVATVDDWPDPLPLPDGLPPVAGFEFALLPATLRPWAADITDRMQCPGDYTGVAIMAALGAVIGRRVGIRPQQSTDWTVTANQWALLIGRPGVLKSPAMEAALGPIKRLAAAAVDRYQTELSEYERAKVADKLRAEAAERSARAALSKNPGADISGILTVDKSEPPTMTRYMANDTTAAALGELHRQNPNGLLVFRDELVSLLRSLDQEENSEARGFYLTGWNGDSPYTFDRISRGMHLHIPGVCLSLLGSTQPARIAQYVKGAVNGNSDDGLLQRFGLTVWPDISDGWRDVDRWPDSEAKREALKVFERLARLDPRSIGAKQDSAHDGDPDGTPYFLRFDPAGLELFREWRKDLEKRLRSGDLHPAYESHLAKYRKLIPGLALICHLAEEKTGPVDRAAALMALAWGEYLESHARRLYASVTAPDAATARRIIAKIRSGALSSVLSVRDIYRPQWAGLTDQETIKAGVKLLVERDWLIETRKDTGGRPSFEYQLNPRTGGLK